MTISLFFPAYNEEANIEEAIKRADAVLQRLPRINDYEIIVVDDGSIDQTTTIVERLALSSPKIILVRHGQNKGYGAALRTGFKAARFEYIFFTDADLQFDLAELKTFFAFVPKYKAVVGYRAKRMDPFIRIVNARLWGFLARLLLGVRARDVNCAFKLLESALIKSIQISSEGSAFNTELLFKIKAKNVAIKELPVHHFPRVAGIQTGAHPKVIMRALREIFTLYCVNRKTRGLEKK